MADVLCPNCGKPNSDHREFCDFCDNPLDGALRVEESSDSPRDNLLGDQPQESLDDASRLDSLVPAPGEESQPSRLDDFRSDEPLNGDSLLDSLIPAPGEESQPSRLDDFRSDEPLNGDSRLESLLADDFEEPTQKASDDPDLSNGGSRLDTYLPIDEPLEVIEPETTKKDDSSRLDEYISPEEPEDRVRLTTESLYTEPEDTSSRLNDYLSPETPQESSEADDSSRLDDFFADDPFKSPDPLPSTSGREVVEEDSYSLEQDPFGEPPPPASEPSPADQIPAEEPPFSRDDLLSDSSPKQTPGELEFLDLISDTDKLEEESSPAPIDSTEWDFLESSPPTEQPSEDKPAESFDSGEWNRLDPAPTSEKPDDDKPADSIDPGEWDFLDPAPEAGQPGKGSVPESIEGGEWDFLDPPSSDADQVEKSPKSTEDDSSEDWSFLDPGPTADLVDDEVEPASMPEGDREDAGWLDMLQDPESRQKADTSTTEPQKPQTDWLDKIRRLNQSSDLVDEDSSFPDWLAATGKTAEFAGEDPESSDDVPDWLELDDDESLNEFLRKKDLTNEEYKPKVTTDSLDEADVPDDMDASDLELSDSQQIKFPSWAEEKKQKALKRKESQAAAGLEEGTKEPAEAFQIEEEIFDDLFSEELPSWLTAAATEDIRQSIGENLAQGELPGWVEAMRPVVESTDASGLDDDEEYIENYGPLAGIPSVLPAEAEIGIDFDKAVQKPLDLLATKKHKEYVDLLNKLIEDETKSKTIRLPAPLQTQRVLRWLIAIIMLVAIAGTLIFSGSIDAQPLTAAQTHGAGFSALYEEIEILYDGQPVLIAFDYQPAAAGELHTVAATVVDHLMEQGTFLTFISTQPTGPALAEHFLDSTQSHHNYIHTQKYINLGYLPGESAGLLSFMIAPQKIIPLAFDGSNAWDSPPLISIDGIGDFKMILVITDDPNTAKIWIEQVGTRLDETPLVMVVSAQVEPLIQPYFRTSPRQVSGYVAGIIDSMNYEVITERPFLANKNWLPFNLGIVISVGIIFIGGLTNGVLSLFSRRKDKAGGESK